GLHALVESVHNHHEEHQHAVHDAVGSDGDVAARFFEGVVDEDDDDTGADVEQERGQTDGEHLAYDGSDEAERTALEVQEVFAVEEMDEFEYERHALPGDGGDSRTAHAPAEPEDEER